MDMQQNIITEVEDNNVKPQLHKTSCCVQPFSCRTDAVSELYHMDCIQGMKHYPDKYFDLAIVDPPYGLGIGKSGGYGLYKTYKKFTGKKWDSEIPNEKYFLELWRVSKNRIIWGGNYFLDFLPATRCMLVWDKKISGKYGGTKFSDAEIAWTSFDTAVRRIILSAAKPINEKIHPTQKPVELYDWVLSRYAQKGMKILDTHVGSGSSRISCYKNGFDFVGFEIDKQYCEASEKRFINETMQQKLFI